MQLSLILSLFIACSETNESNFFKTGLFTQTYQQGNLSREYVIYIPQSYDGTENVPLLLVFHGFGGRVQDMMYTADFRDLAESENFILVYPQGLEFENESYSYHWNTGFSSDDNKSSSDDFGFVEGLIGDVSTHLLVDTSKIYATGYSNGGFFTYALACYYSDLFTAIAPVSGTMMDDTYEACNPSHPTPVMHLHGTDDGTVSYNGGEGLTSVDESIGYWTSYNNTDTTPSINTFSNQSLEHYVYDNGERESSVELYKVLNGEHIWFDFELDGVPTNTLMWNFLSKYNMNDLR